MRGRLAAPPDERRLILRLRLASGGPAHLAGTVRPFRAAGECETMTSSVTWAPLDHAAREPVRAGDLISAEAGGLPIYRVVAWEKGRAWVSTRDGAPARAMPLDRFCWRGIDG